MFGFKYLGNTRVPHRKNTAEMPAVKMPAPDEVRDGMVRLLTETDPVALHGYTSAQGAPATHPPQAVFLPVPCRCCLSLSFSPP